MEKEIGRMVCSFESGRMTRRELVTGLMALAAAGNGASATALAQQSTFQATGLNHIALRVILPESIEPPAAFDWCWPESIPFFGGSETWLIAKQQAGQAGSGGLGPGLAIYAPEVF